MSNTNDNLLSSASKPDPVSPILLAVTFFLCVIFGGVFGLVCWFAMFIVARRSFAIDRFDKHGISTLNSSRLGGVAVVTSIMVYYFIASRFQLPSELLLLEGFDTRFLVLGGYSLLIGLIGMIDDLGVSIRPNYRLTIQFVTVVFVLYMDSSLIPLEFFESDLLSGLNNTLFLGLGSLVIVVGFINAGNMVDGANGLLAVTLNALFLSLFLITQEVFLLLILVSLLIFSIFNVITGRVMLGDFGAYIFSAFAALTCLSVYSSYEISEWFFAAMLSYPCMEIVKTIFTRLRKGRSPLYYDNQHLHNLVYAFYTGLGLRSLIANSLTGLSLAFVFSVVPMFLFISEVLAEQDSSWIYVFIVQFLILLSSQLWLRRYAR